MFTNLLSKLEGEFNATVEKLQHAADDNIQHLLERKATIERLIGSYVELEKQYAELAGLNSIY